MKILLFRTDPSILNVKNYNSQEIGLAKAYTALGHQCDIVYYNGRNAGRTDSIDVGNGKTVRIFWMKGFSVLNNGFFPGITQLAKEYDVIQVSEYYFWASWYIYKRFNKKKKVYVYQGVYDADNSKRFTLRCKITDPILLNRKICDETCIFTKSSLAAQSMRKRGFKRVQTVGVGLDVDRFASPEAGCAWGESLKKNKRDDLYFLYIGVLEDRRNILFLLDILKNVTQRMQNVKLVMVGTGTQQYTNICMQRIQSLNLQDHIIKREKLTQPELRSLYEACDLFLLPSKFEIFGMVLLEAMHFGLPIVSSYNGGSSTLIHDEVNGCIVREFSVLKWSERILELLEDPEKRKSMAEATRQTSTTEFTWHAIAKAILAALKC